MILRDTTTILGKSLGVSNVLDNDTQNNMKNTLENLSITTKNLNKASLAALEILDINKEQLNSTFINVKETSDNLRSITDSISNAQISFTIREFTKTCLLYTSDAADE